jgi:hypothetical protein
LEEVGREFPFANRQMGTLQTSALHPEQANLWLYWSFLEMFKETLMGDKAGSRDNIGNIHDS